MTVMLTSSFINSIPISDPNAYVVALNEDGLVVGSQLVFDRTQATIAYGEMTAIRQKKTEPLLAKSLLFNWLMGRICIP